MKNNCPPIMWIPATKSCLWPDMPTPPAEMPTTLENFIAEELREMRIEAIEAMSDVEARVLCKLIEFLSQPDDEISQGGKLTKEESLAVLWYRTLSKDEQAIAHAFIARLDGSE